MSSAGGYEPEWPMPRGVRSWQTTRAGGVSGGSFSSLNLGPHVGDDGAAVAENRRRLRETLGLAAEPRWLEQVHGSRILRLDRGETGAADGAVTLEPGVICAVMTADCLPVLLCDRSGTAIGVAHAGWRGLAAGVLAAAVAAMPVRSKDLLVWLGPAISQPSFEVGDEVREAFVAADSAAAAAFAANPAGRWQADLYWLACRQLERAGVEAVYGETTCTYRDAERFFSHRREAPCGRMATLIWREIA
ncbi:MAG: peptidoglycan editing factor PgeF [Gammaproteobacteria bacterium]|nr:peptidoglycan editing factor PgeF [Gammaproteobacteria bacterium]